MYDKHVQVQEIKKKWNLETNLFHWFFFFLHFWCLEKMKKNPELDSNLILFNSQGRFVDDIIIQNRNSIHTSFFPHFFFNVYYDCSVTDANICINKIQIIFFYYYCYRIFLISVCVRKNVRIEFIKKNLSVDTLNCLIVSLCVPCDDVGIFWVWIVWEERLIER